MMFFLSSPRASKLAVQRQGGCFGGSMTPTRTPPLSRSASQLPSSCMATWSSTLALALLSRRCRPKPRLGRRCVAQKILEVLESLEDIPSPHFVSGEATKSGVIVKGSDSEPLSWPMDVEPLLEDCTQAQCGRGSETVTDLSVRSVMETQKVKVEWPELPEVLNEVERKLLPDTILRAEFDKLLVYRPRDFFKGHRDSKRSDNHVATLIAIAGCPHKGGAVVFREADEEAVHEQSKLRPRAHTHTRMIVGMCLTRRDLSPSWPYAVCGLLLQSLKKMCMSRTVCSTLRCGQLIT